MTPQTPPRWPKATGRDTRRTPRELDLTWPYKDRHMLEALAAAPAGHIDPALLPPALAAKLADRDRAGVPSAPLTWRPATATAATVVLGLGLAAPPAAALAVTGPTATILTTGAVATTAWLVMVATLLCRHPRLIYTRAERRCLDAARVHWPAHRAALTQYPNPGLVDEWDARLQTTAAQHAGTAALVWPEPNLVAVAGVLTAGVYDTKAWASPLLDIYRVRMDVDKQLHRIALLAHRRWRQHAANLGPISNHDATWRELVDLVDQISAYRTHLLGIDAIFTAKALLDLDVDDALLIPELGIDTATGQLDRNQVRDDITTQLHRALDDLAIKTSTES